MFRKTLFWLHLLAGVIAGTIIGIMCATGVVLAFEHEIVEWAERDAREVTVPPGAAARLPLDTLLEKVEAQRPGEKYSGVTVFDDPAKAVAVSYGRDQSYYVNPYTGEVRQPASTAVHDFMHVMIDWHRWLAMSGDQRATGKAITGACNVAFLVLGVTGLYLWWPRQWTRRVLRPSWRFVAARGRARDWNWHNVIGFWSLPVLIVLTVSGMVISYRWASNTVYRAFGETPPAQNNPGAAPIRNAAAQTEAAPAPSAPLTVGALFTAAQAAAPNWESIQLRRNAPRGGAAAETAGGQGSVPPTTFTVREWDRFPTFATTSITVDSYTGNAVNASRFADQTPGRQARLWLRFLHVGQGFGWVGQVIAMLASLGGVVLVYTGFALAIRRLAGSLRRSSRPDLVSSDAVETRAT